MAGVARILSQVEKVDPTAADMLLPLVYEELRKLAAAKLSRHDLPDETEAACVAPDQSYLRLTGPNVSSSHAFTVGTRVLGLGECPPRSSMRTVFGSGSRSCSGFPSVLSGSDSS